ncbi:hypothetical protein H8356DRAFT_1357981 [Neocallimastix lanati (nom. inval.)]|nr:hypothetical protein H8356DRAFT_1357981 [Neocallimastix sp. JGI-2020a]
MCPCRNILFGDANILLNCNLSDGYAINQDIYSNIKSECQEHNYIQFLEFLKFLEYFKKTYLISYETENWNYYDNIEYITNNVSETFNKYLKKLF